MAASPSGGRGWGLLWGQRIKPGITGVAEPSSRGPGRGWWGLCQGMKRLGIEDGLLGAPRALQCRHGWNVVVYLSLQQEPSNDAKVFRTELYWYYNKIKV